MKGEPLAIAFIIRSNGLINTAPVAIALNAFALNVGMMSPLDVEPPLLWRKNA